MSAKNIVLGAGFTGLAIGLASDLPVFEAKNVPGGICASYYMHPHSTEKHAHMVVDDEAYRFEVGGGHWIFGGDPAVLQFIKARTPVKSYHRRSSVYFCDRDLYIAYPLQNHLHQFGAEIASQAINEMAFSSGPVQTMQQWLERSFGPTLCEKFFYPFHDLYTAGLYDKIAPQDAYKSPVDLSLVIQGAMNHTPAVGYNTTYIYPVTGLDALAQQMTNRCHVYYGKRAVQIDTQQKKVFFSDNSVVDYDKILSTLPLNQMADLTGVDVQVKPDPHTSVLVLNIGAVRGAHCPDDHWLYTPDAKARFHRVGFYSNIDRSFLPTSSRERNDRVSIYVEKAYVGGNRPSDDELAHYIASVIDELQAWQFIDDVEVVDPTWIDVAYTWSWPQSTWKRTLLKQLEENDIYQVGRYGRWVFQGIADSIKEGFAVGASLRQHPSS